MTTVRYLDYDVSVSDADCAARSCFSLGFDKGSFTPGTGYTSYYAKQRPVCMTRHLHGCPHREDVVEARCGSCHVLIGRVAREEMPTLCPSCGSADVYRVGVLLDPLPCCESPNVPHSQTARTQTCRSCKKRLSGWQLKHARSVS